jgi:hypothetical protein
LYYSNDLSLLFFPQDTHFISRISIAAKGQN